MATGLSPEHKALSEDRVEHLLAQYSGATPTGQPNSRTGRTHMSPLRDAPHTLHPSLAAQPRTLGATGSELASSWAAIPTAINGGSPDPVDDSSSYPTAAEIIDILHTKVAILSGGRDRQGRSIITFPAHPKGFELNRDAIRKVIQYLACIPTEDVREYGFSVIVDGRSSNWQNIKLILRTLQEALPAQINVVYTIQPGQFWQKQQISRGHHKERAKLEFSTEPLSSPDKLIRYVESSQLTSDLGGFLPYNHDMWIKLRLDLEHFISSFNALMEHTAHVEQQLVGDAEPTSVELVEECLTRLVQMQEQLRKAPQSTIREGNDMLRALEQGREEAGSSGMTPDKINAQSIIRKLLDKIGQRQMQLDDLWRERKGVLEQTLQLRVFEKSMVKVRFWLKSRAEEQLASRCDVGTTVDGVRSIMEQHDKFEAKAKRHLTALTQLRRMADRFSGEQLDNAGSLQRQVAKLSARFSKFEELLAERRMILQNSLKLHSTMKQWRGLCQVTSELLKQEMSSKDDPPSDELLGNHGDHTTQLWQVADSAVSEASSLLELMRKASQKLPSEGSKGAGPGYAPGMDHVSRLMEEVENHRQRVGQLAEVRKLQAEELKRLYSCERDTQQVTQWLQDMLTQQLLPGHGDVGDSVTAVERLAIGHRKFSDNAHKHYKYGCDLVAAAQRIRKSCRLDPHPSSALLTNLNAIWGQLSTAMTEVKGRLEMAREFHSLTEESLASYKEWNRPIHQLPKTPALIEKKVQDMTENQGQLRSNLTSALEVGQSLLERFEQPLSSDPGHTHHNEPTKRSLTFLRGKLDELQRVSKELDSAIPQQVKLLKNFLLYCQFEASIENILLWLQEHGLKQMHTFSHVSEGQRSIQTKMDALEKFEKTVKAHSIKVEQLHSEASDMDHRIQGFKSDLSKKAASLKSVWVKFTTRLQNRRTVISLAAGFYDDVEEFRGCCQFLEALTSDQELDKSEQGKEELEKAFKSVCTEGEKLLAKIRVSPGDQSSVLQRLSSLMEELRKQKNHIDGLLAERTAKKVKVHNGSVRTNGVGRESPPQELEEEKISKKYTNMYAELEEEAYKHLEELENKCDQFFLSHTKLRDSPDGAKHLCSEYNRFLSTFDPMEAKLEGVVKELSALCPKVPPLSASIQQLCTNVRGRIAAHRTNVEQRSRILNMYDQFLDLFKKVNSDLDTLDQFLSGPVEGRVSMEMLGKYKQVADRLHENHSKTKSLGEQFLESTSEMLAVRAGPRFEVGGACTSVAFDLGELDGRYPDIVERWAEREKELTQQMDWQSFKATYDEITTWLKESASKFLETRIDVGTSLETAEDLLMELGEFEIRAKRIADEVESLLVHTEALLSGGVRESSELGDISWDLRCLHDDFQQQLKERNTSLKDAVSFFMTSEQLRTDMQTAVESCDHLMTQDLPTHLKITSVSTRLANLEHQGSKLLQQLGVSPPTPSHTSKQRRTSRVRRTDSSSASELAIKQVLASLQEDFTSYKRAIERRVIKSPSSRGEAIIRGKSDLKSPPPPKNQEALKNEKKTPTVKAADQGSLLVPFTRARTFSGDELKPKRRSSAVLQKVKALNKKSTKEDAEALKEIGTLFGPRPRSNTADPTMSPSKGRSPELPRRSRDIESPQQPDPPAVVTRQRSPTIVESVPLRQKGGGVSRNERKEKINAIKRIFEATSAESATTAEEKRKSDKSHSAVTRTQSDQLEKARGEGQHVTMATHERYHTLPAVVKAVLKDNLPAKQRVITITMEPEKPATPPLLQVENGPLPDTTDLPVAPSRDTPPPILHSRAIRATRSVSPQAMHHATPPVKSGISSSDSSPIRRAARRPPPLRVSGKVSSLRDMFDSHTKANSPRLRTGSYSGKSPSLEQDHKPSIGLMTQSALLEVSSDESMRRHSPDIAPKEEPHPPYDKPHPSVVTEPAEKSLPRTNISTDEPDMTADSLHPQFVPRPPSPVWRELEEASESSGCETSEFELSADDESDSSDEPDGEEPDSGRITKSVSAVIEELIQSELVYSRSVEVLATIYEPMLSESHVPTFLQGRSNSIFSSLAQIHSFQRDFSPALCHHGNTIEAVCQAFIQQATGFHSYIPFLINMERGLSILTEYGGSFFEDKQRAIGDQRSITEHYCRLKERVVEYDHHLRQLSKAAQKEALHAVNLAKEALHVIQKFLRDVDNTLLLNSLEGCPHSLTLDCMIRRDLFQAYTTRGKKKVREYHVILTPDAVILTRAKMKDGKISYEFRESLKVAELHLLETYKSRDDTFALCEGNLSSDNLQVLTPVSTPILMKVVWLQEIRPLLQKKHTRRVIVGEEDAPLPHFFHGTNMPRPLDHVTQAIDEREGWIGSLRRGKSFRSSMKRTESLRRNKRSAKEKGESLKRTQSLAVRRIETISAPQEPHRARINQPEETVSRSSQISTSSGGVADVQLGTLTARGQFLPAQDDELYLVVEAVSSTREGFLSVEKGQLVEVLDNSKSIWMVLTVARQRGELEMEGFLPASCLRLASKDEVREAMSVPSSHPASLSHDQSHDQLAPQMREVSNEAVVAVEKSTTPPETTAPELPLDPTPSQSPVQNLSNSVTIVPRHHDDIQSESPSAGEASLAQPSPVSNKRIKPPALDLTNATPTFDRPPYPRMHDMPPYHDQGPHLSPMINRRKLWEYGQGEEFTSSIRSLPTTFSPVTPKSVQRYLGYDPMQVPEVTLSYPELGPPAPPTEERRKAREELSKLREATVKSRDAVAPGSVEEFDPVEVYVAIADFEAVEESSISLIAGQCVEVLDSSRSDWWLVFSSELGQEGWVPACYLEQLTLTDPTSPPPDPFVDETGELAALMGRSLSELNRRELYNAPFLNREEPSDSQLQGVYSLAHPYMAVTEIQAEYPGQLSLVQDQPVMVVDSKRDDWWLVRALPEEEGALPAAEGWVPRSMLHPDENIREDFVVEGNGPVTSAFEETTKVPVKPRSPQLTPRMNATSPSSTLLWEVLASYQATELGMLTVSEGELVEVLDISRNEWCLVRPQTRPLEEGWVPMNFLKPYNSRGYANPSLQPPRFRQRSSSSDSDTSTEPERPLVAFSPEGYIEAPSKEARTEAKERRRFVLSEMASTEKDYVEKLKYCLKNYYPLNNESTLPLPSQAARDTLFGNMKEIYDFHKKHILPELQASEIDPLRLSDLFVSSEQQLRMYVTYCRNKGASDTVYHDHTPYFDERHNQLEDRLKLPDYLILPVQRITKYTLLLHDFHKYSVRAGLESGDILSALEVSRGVSTLANNAIHLNMLDERVSHLELGELVMQELFGSQEGQKQLYKERRIFLFEHALIITKRRRDNGDKESYVVKELLMLCDISMTQDMDPGHLNIITYNMITGTKFILRAPKTSVRDAWLQRANELIRAAKQKSSFSARGRSSSEPSEFFHSRSPSLSRHPLFKRESTKRKSSSRPSSRPQSSSGVRRLSASPEEHEPPGTEYMVMECIVMEGGDDVTLDPGDIVKLVKVEGDGSVLRVRTVDDTPVEGKILASYLRKRESVIQGHKMEAIPKFTMQPVDMDLLAGTTATISCAFNGYPHPSITWRKDLELLTGEDERWRITSCPTSSVLEITRLDYSDEGPYSCCITNSMGSDSADMLLTIYGPPSQPQKPIASKITSSSVKLKWNPPENDGKSLVHSYQVEMLQEGFEEWQQIIQQPRTHFVVKSLLPNTTYHFRVTAYNEHGASPPSESTKVVAGTKGRWQSFRRGNAPQITVNNSTDSTDGPFDELSFDDNTLSPQAHYIRRGSISNAYDVMPEELGRGQYGIVHRCLHKGNGTELAAKYVRLRSKRKAAIRKEVEILRKIRGKSPNLLEFWDAFERGRNLIIVTESVRDGELVERIISENNLTEGIAVGYLSQLLSAVEVLHSLNIAHLDIRPENLLLTGDTLKLVDFGSAKEMTSDLTPIYTSSVEFAAPEILKQELPSLSSDMWSVGVLTYLLLSGISPFFADNIQAIVERIKEARYSFYHPQFEQVSQEAKEFISALLQKSSEYRTSATKALEHPWIKTLHRLNAREGCTSPWPMARLDVSGLKAFNARRKWLTLSIAVDDTTVFGPRSTICLSPAPPDFEEMAKNEAPPHLWDGPSKLQACVGSKVTISYAVAGNPEPTVIWEHEDVEVTPSRHHMIKTSGGVTSVVVTDVKREDEGMYLCTALNSLGSVGQECQLTVLDAPGPPLEVSAVILGTYNSAMVSWLPPADTGNCPITKYIIQKKQLQHDVWEEVTSVSGLTAHVVEDLIPGITYLFQVCAVNEVGVGRYSQITEKVAIAREREYGSESPGADEIQLKTSPFEIEYEMGEEIARGSFTSVLKCRERTTDRLYAAKLISSVMAEQKERALSEYDVHQRLSHPRLVKMEDAFLSDAHLTLVMEFLSGGTLQDLLTSEPKLTEDTASGYVCKMAEGLEYLHETKIILVNLSPENILLTSDHNDLKICDFSMSRFIESGNQLSTLDGRAEHMAPEVVGLQPLTTAADIWSLGTIAYLMLTGSSPFLGPTQDATIANISSCQLDTGSAPYSTLSSDAHDFVQYRVLVRNPRRRLTAAQCQRHHWLQSRSSRRSSVDLPLSVGRRGSDLEPHPQKQNSSGVNSTKLTSNRLSLS